MAEAAPKRPRVGSWSANCLNQGRRVASLDGCGLKKALGLEWLIRGVGSAVQRFSPKGLAVLPTKKHPKTS